AARTATASTHNSGGRQSTFPIQSPPAKASAAQNNGWRAGVSSGSIRGLGAGMLRNSVRSRNGGAGAVCDEAKVYRQRDELAGQVKNAFDVECLGEQIDQMGLYHLISQSHKGAQVPGQGRWVARNVGDSRNIEPCQAANDVFPQPAAWGIGNHKIGMKS